MTDAADGGGERYRYVEPTLAPGTAVTALGAVTDDETATAWPRADEGPTLSAGAGDLLVAAGSRSVGLLLAAASLRWLVGAFAVSL